MSGIITDNLGLGSGLVKAVSAGGVWNKISAVTASNDSSVSFTSGIDSTYDKYCFIWNNVNTATGGESDAGVIQINFSVDGGSNYNVTKTTSMFQSYHKEDDNEAYAAYSTYWDLAQATGASTVMNSMGAGADECGAGYLFLYGPASTTFIKHFFGEASIYHQDDFTQKNNFAGYGNTTSAIDAVQFTALGASYSGSDNFDGVFTMYGIS